MINAVELMPIFEFDELMNCREVDREKLLEYWVYNTVSFFAPNTSYVSTEEYNQEGTELKELIKELHNNGIEVILDAIRSFLKGECLFLSGRRRGKN